MSTALRCALCTKPTTQAKTFMLLCEHTGHVRVPLCPACVTALLWRADDPILIAEDFDGHLPRLYAGRAVRAILRNLRTAAARRRAELEATKVRDHGPI